jgi:hypothetical protein
LWKGLDSTPRCIWPLFSCTAGGIGWSSLVQIRLSRHPATHAHRAVCHGSSRPITRLELRRAVVGYPETLVRSAVEAGLRECPFTRLPNKPSFAPLVTFWLLDPDSLEILPPPLTEAQVAAIHRRLVAAAN